MIRLDKKENRVIVGPLSALYRDRLFLSGMNWLDETSTETLDQIEIQFRSRQIPIPATLTRYADNGAMVVLKNPAIRRHSPRASLCRLSRGTSLRRWLDLRPTLTLIQLTNGKNPRPKKRQNPPLFPRFQSRRPNRSASPTKTPPRAVPWMTIIPLIPRLS